MPLKNLDCRKRELKAAAINEEFIICFVYCAGLAIAAFLNFSDPKADHRVGYVYSSLFALAFIAKGSQAVKKRRNILQDEKSDIAIEAVLESVYQTLLITIKEGEDDPAIRLTIYRLSENEKFLIQHTKYFGDGVNEIVRHKVAIEKGVIGAAFRTKKVATCNRGPTISDEQFIEDMVNTFSYTEEEAKNLSRDRRAWIALPVVEVTGVHSVLFCDAKVCGFFGSKRTIRYRVLEGACAGLAEFLARP